MINHLIEQLDQLEAALGSISKIEILQKMTELQWIMVEHWADFSASEGSKVSGKVFDLLDKIRHSTE